ncbi:spore germination protein GerW family protein [Nocardioides euryhalodurans]|uniref:Sporulation protein n=1 Tax=Nocardioides euryhalodurans TaxID=2518370 RepID=A0A4P7GI72_9ACTN|nr:spore germination protein GerW family protein [Nocardioides euryhalodurans]QBR91513.1 sporulation protein [Nocardioides euryhalodurans]
MDLDELMSTARESLTVRRVFGDPVERGGLTVIPAASVTGGLGGGKGTDPKGQEGEGGGFGMSGRPAGVFVIGDGQVTWRPALDANRAFTVVGLVVAAYLLTRPRLARARSAHAATSAGAPAADD